MRSFVSKVFVKYQDARLQRLHEDDRGLSLVAYALGAAFIVVPMALALFLFGQGAADEADAGLAEIIAAGG
ncbi:MAG: hypothetical protein V3V06_06785 [Dehalococcoidia bacterium]